MSRTEELRRLGLAWNEAWNARDPARLAGFFAPASTFFEPSLAEPVDGAVGVAASAAKTWSEWPRAVFEPVSVTVEGSRVVVEWRTVDRHRSGVAHVLEGVDILEFEQDLVVACRSYYDTRTASPSPRRRR
jgi:SnoaL-like domain